MYDSVREDRTGDCLKQDGVGQGRRGEGIGGRGEGGAGRMKNPDYTSRPRGIGAGENLHGPDSSSHSYRPHFIHIISKL